MLHATHSDCLQKGCKRGVTFSSCVIFNLPQLSCCFCCCKCIHYSFMFLTHSLIRCFFVCSFTQSVALITKCDYPILCYSPPSLSFAFICNSYCQAGIQSFIHSFIHSCTHSFIQPSNDTGRSFCCVLRQSMSDCWAVTRMQAPTQAQPLAHSSHAPTHTHTQREETHTHTHSCTHAAYLSALCPFWPSANSFVAPLPLHK